MSAVAAAAAAVAVLLVLRPPPRVGPRPPVSPPVPASRAAGAWRLRRGLVAAAAGCGGWVVVGGTEGVAVGVVVAVVAAVVLARAEPAAVRREREEAARELPHLVDLLAATLRAGAAPLDGLATVTAALPGAAARRVEPVLAQARFGGSLARLDVAGDGPVTGEGRAGLADDEVLSPLLRALARAERSGSSIVEAVERLADELEREAGAAAEDAARRVGVAAAVPLGVCLLPAFLLIGIVPTVAGLLSTVTR